MKNIDNVIIRRPRIEEIDLINEFFIIMLKDTFEINGLGSLKELLEEEIQDKKRYINQDFQTNGIDRFFLLAEYNEEIIGSIEYGKSNDLLNKCTDHKFKHLYEIGTVFVHPKYKRQGVASLLFYKLFQKLESNGVKEICFDSGYKTAQKIWCKKFGEPEYFLKDYWGKGTHHMVWRVNVKDALDLFNLIKEVPAS